MAKRLKRSQVVKAAMLAYAYGGQHFPHAEYGVDLDKVPDTYVEPFVA